MTDKNSQRPEMVTSRIDVLTAIRERRSIRRYTAEPVDDACINTVLQAGLCAPTAMNRRPYHFIVIRDRDTLTKLAAGKQYASMLSDAQAAFVVCGDSSVETGANISTPIASRRHRICCWQFTDWAWAVSGLELQ